MATNWQQSLGPVLDGVGKSITQIFAPEAKSPVHKACRTDSARSTSPQSAQPFSNPERQWLASAVNECNRASTLALATAVDTRFQVVEAGIEEVKAISVQQSKTLEEMKAMSEQQSKTLESLTKDLGNLHLKQSEQSSKVDSKIEDLDIKHSNQMNELREKIDQTPSKPETNPSAHGSGQDPWFQAAFGNGKSKGKGVPGTNTPVKAKEEWSGLWVLGNLGFDTDPETLVERARAILSKLQGFNIEDLVQDIRTQGKRPGSMVLVEFKQQSEGDNWESKVFNLKHTYPENESALRTARNQPGAGTVFLGKQQTEAQRRPMKLTKRCGEELTRIENCLDPEQRKPIKVETRGKLVMVGGETVGHSFHGSWQWTEAGARHLRERGVHQGALTASIEQSW